MRSNSFAISLGLAAIDGLLCAFVAVLMLALVLIGPGISANAPDVMESQKLLFLIKNADTAARGIDLHMLVDIKTEGSSDVASFTVESGGRMTQLKGLTRHVQAGGAIWWKDCQILAGSECSATLFVTRIKPNERWHVRLRVADAGNSFTAGGTNYLVRANLDSGWLDSAHP
jgi:hypothetical protein